MLVNGMHPNKRSCLNLCLEFLRNFTTYETNDATIATERLQSIFQSQQNLSNNNIMSIISVLKLMIESIATLFKTQYSTEESQSSSVVTIENPPILFNLPGPTFKAE